MKSGAFCLPPRSAEELFKDRSLGSALGKQAGYTALESFLEVWPQPQMKGLNATHGQAHKQELNGAHSPSCCRKSSK